LLQFGCHEKVADKTVYRWRDDILANMDIIEPVKEGKQMIQALHSAVRQCQLKIRVAPTESDKRGYMNTLCNLTTSMTDMLEKYGHKEKVADKHLIFGSNKIEVTFIDPDEDEQIDEKMNKEANK
jgi:hypothetical protein